jgi:hypothetical protein
MDAMPKPKKPKEITTQGLLKKIRKPPAPPARVHPDHKKYKRTRVRIGEQNDPEDAGS